MNMVSGVVRDVAQPRNARVRGLRYRTLHVDLEYGLGGACPQFGQSPPPGIA